MATAVTSKASGQPYGYADTIAAIATALGEGAIGIVRVSGPEALPIAHAIFRRDGKNATFQPQRMYYGHIVDPATQTPVDEVMAVYFAPPRTYTREPMIEFNCHGGVAVLERVLRLCLSRGARIAEPGEFTLRAFLNGRIDLTQAEAVLDMVKTRTGAGLQSALDQLAGRLSQRISLARAAVLRALAKLEAQIDFPEDDVPPLPVTDDMREAQTALDALLATVEAGQIIRQGLRVAIAGAPNVGKSSLLNALLRTDRAIVTPIAGTTRDLIEESATIEGLPMVLTDTAGIAETDDIVEQIGIERSRSALSAADLVLWVCDGSRALTDGERALARHIAEVVGADDVHARTAGRLVVAVNKRDLSAIVDEAEIAQIVGADVARVSVSARSGAGLPNLERTLARTALAGRGADSGVAGAGGRILVTNQRHRRLLERAHESIGAALASEEAGLPADFVSIDLRLALDALGEITGESVHAALLHEIFANFCIGK